HHLEVTSASLSTFVETQRSVINLLRPCATKLHAAALPVGCVPATLNGPNLRSKRRPMAGCGSVPSRQSTEVSRVVNSEAQSPLSGTNAPIVSARPDPAVEA